MRVICLVNNHLGWRALEYMRSREQVVGVIAHPPHRAKFAAEIESATRAAKAELFTAEDLKSPEKMQQMAALKPDVGLSVMFGYLLKPDFLKLFPRGCLNLHPAYLPYNRGAYPNVWSIVEGTPAGVTLHYIDEGIDSGDIVAQKQIPVAITDTGESLYGKLETLGLQLLAEAWPAVSTGQAKRTPQRATEGTVHKTRDVERIDEIQLDRHYPAEALLNILRARTFPPYRGAFFRHEGKKIYVRVQFEEEADGESRG